MCFSLVSAMTSWQSWKQSSIALSTAEAEYIVACSASCEAIWLRKLLTGLFDLEMEATMILCDNQSCIKMTENHMFHDKSKHIEIRYHYIRDMVQSIVTGSAPPPPPLLSPGARSERERPRSADGSALRAVLGRSLPFWELHTP
jgi:hypothetical protein